ncbi:uncharacterized protein LOC122067563 [Macadamia integrifolia]|uniref:uncharacterized protein LOC122067563 n=1 Tax=Macadamia integrifolia TaxID=60698 RepID=UPI001C4FFB23|nr:uncharacterized protein LOC122067563 [Macadamia integrifolia]
MRDALFTFSAEAAQWFEDVAIACSKMEYGEIYDCVDFYKQPAFDNPLLKNHKPEMSSSIPRETYNETSSEVEPLDFLRLDDGGCPSGTVPIRRTTKEDLIRWKSYSNSSEIFHQFLDEGPGKLADGSQKTGCFNSICNGFVQVNKDVPLGLAFSRTSIYGEDPYSVLLFLYQDKKSRNWWIAIGFDSVNIGYWPKELFNSIKESAPVVGWRGEVYTPQGEQYPPMGTGHFESHWGKPIYQKTAYFRVVRVNGDDDIGRGPNDASLEPLSNGCFTEKDLPYVNDYWRHTFFYGGHGGTC